MPLKTLLLVFLFTSSFAYAQDDFVQLFRASQADATALTELYASPLVLAMGHSFNNGWYTTANAHKTFGFDLTITANATLIPTSEETFNFVNSDYSTIKLVNGSEALTPTLLGTDKDGPRVEVFDPENPNIPPATFSMPRGLGLQQEIGMNIVPLPMIQLGVGIIAKTDIKVRFIPEQNYDIFSYKLWGIGIQHEIKQYFPALKYVPMDLAIFGGYTNSHLTADLSGEFNGENQVGEFLIQSYTIQALISKKISVLTFYGGLGYNGVTSNLSVLGSYDIEGDVIEDPIETNFDDKGFRGTAGMRLKFGFFELFGDFTFGSYNVATAGFGFNFMEGSSDIGKK